MDGWWWAILIYLGAALLTLIPTLRALFSGIKPNPGGASFEKATFFSEENRDKLAQHYSRLAGTLGFWKDRAETYTAFHYYCVVWTILSAWAVPLVGSMAPQVEGSPSKWLIVIISSHVALALSFHRGLKVAEGMKAFRHGESEFYDLYRRLLDRPHLFGNSEESQMDAYFAEVERIRRLVRHAETETIPTIDDLRSTNNQKS
ncbi:hypothetical protein [Sphingomonas sp.]|uniref:hypothetical protein n=1 Tax=Sphingomonas sp. TaxID=28214 RepID=UPI001B2CB281|nr:hypothetical protein [Sphingomonas sp.]MBO9714172.1 hypothetical protein [Sphingomonas sp.]